MVNKIVLKGSNFCETAGQDLTGAMDAFRSSGLGTIVVHFHGGLVTQEAAEETAERLGRQYASAGGFPLFIIWQTGLIETLQNNWKEIFCKEFFEGVLERVLQFLVGRAEQPPGAKSGSLQVRHPKEIRAEIAEHEREGEPYSKIVSDRAKMDPTISEAEKKQLEEAICHDESLVRASRQVANEPIPSKLAPELRDKIAKATTDIEKGEKGFLTVLAISVALQAFMGALRRFNRGRDHGLYATAVEEVAKAIFAVNWLGGFAWGAMKQDTKDAFGDDPTRSGGSALLSELEVTWQRGLRPRIVLVGHSAGAIFVCELLKAVAKRNMPADLSFEVVLLAPACTFRLLDDTLTLAPGRIAKFRSFAMCDDLERKDRLLGWLYPRSLLYLVSGVLEKEADEPLVGMQRFHSGKNPFGVEEYPNIKRVLDGLDSHKNCWIWSVSTAGAGLNTSCKTHGGFDDENTTTESVKQIVEHGA